jgi:hypothetical protein
LLLHLLFVIVCCLCHCCCCCCCCYKCNIVDMPATYVVPTVTMAYTHHYVKHNTSLKPTLNYSPKHNFSQATSSIFKISSFSQRVFVHKYHNIWQLCDENWLSKLLISRNIKLICQLHALCTFPV